MSQPEALLEEEFSGTAALVGSIFNFSTEQGEASPCSKTSVYHFKYLGERHRRLPPRRAG